MTVQSKSSTTSDAHADPMLPPVKNTFVHFDASPVSPPPGPPQQLLRLHTCPAEVGMAYFFEKIGRVPPCTPAVGSRSSPSTLPVMKSVECVENDDSILEEEKNLVGPSKDEAIVAVEKTQPAAEEEQQAKVVEEKNFEGQRKEEEALGEFFTVPGTKKKRFSGRKSAQEVMQTAKAQQEELEPAAEEMEKKMAVAVPTHEEESPATPEKEEDGKAQQELSKKHEPAFADIEEVDGEEQARLQPPAPVPARPRWADLEEDGSPMPAPALAPPPRKAEERPQRPVFGRPGREARIQQAHKDIEEICSLEFDAVDASSQMGLVGRMLVMLKSLAQTVVFWEGEEKREEEKFRLLGLEEDDMYAIGKRIRRAGKKIDERNFRDAFDQMCEARRWLQDPEWAAAERGRRAEKAAREEEPTTNENNRKKKRTVVAKEEAAAPVVEPVADEDEWQVVGAAGADKKKKKVMKEPEKVRQVATAARNTARAPGSRCCGAEEPKQQKPVVPSAKTQQRPAAAPIPAIAPCRSTTGAPREGTKFLCRFFVGIEAEVKGGFRVCRKIFGPGGENMKSIAREANAKLRLRGRGSGFKEGPELREADEPLMLCLSTEDPEGYRKAVAQVTQLFERIYEEYQEHCKRHGLPDGASRLTVQQKEHPGNPPY